MPKRKPNLLFIYTDEQRSDTLAAYGNKHIHMSHLNRLASESFVFERTYVTQPVCTPSRSTLLTGLYPHTNGCIGNNIPLQPETACLPEIIGDDTYATAHIGKWHLGDEIFAQHGFGHWVSIEDLYDLYYSESRDRSAKSDYHEFLVKKGITPSKKLRGGRFGREECARLPEKLGKPAFVADRASDFIRSHRHRPFICYVNFLEPHPPFLGPRDDQYDRSEVDLPENFASVPGADQPAKAKALKLMLEMEYFADGPLQKEEDWRELIARYWGLCSLVDTHIGRILSTLEECGLDENTIVVFTSDHGDMMGSHRLLYKCLMFEEAVRVPMLIRIPGQKKGTMIGGPMSHIDLVPTLLDLMNLPVPDNLQGKSRKAEIHDGTTMLKDDVFIEWSAEQHVVDLDAHSDHWWASAGTKEEIQKSDGDPVRTIITADGWKLNLSACGETELYNLFTDPRETHNLCSFAGYLTVVDKLKAKIDAWRDRTGDV